MSRVTVRAMHHYFEPRFLLIKVAACGDNVCDSKAEVCGEFSSEGEAEVAGKSRAQSQRGERFLVLQLRTSWEGIKA